MKIVITGGAGFIGSNLAQALVKSHEVVAFDDLSFGYVKNLMHDGEPICKLFIEDARSSKIDKIIEGAEVVFHLAGISSLPICQSQPMLAYDVNVSSLANVLEASRRCGVRRVIFSSTTAVYENNDRQPFKEYDSIYPDLIYSTSKFAAEKVCTAFALNYGMDIIIARFGNVYGPNQDSQRLSPPLTSYLVKTVLNGETPLLYNKSQMQRDYIYVSDVVDLLLKMALFPGPMVADIFNISSGQGYSVPELVYHLSDVLGKPIFPTYESPKTFWDKYPELFEGKYPFSSLRVKDEVYKSSIADSKKAQRIFEWAPVVSIQEGLKRMINYEIAHSALRG